MSNTVRLQKAVNLYASTARFDPLTVTGTFDVEARQGVAFVAKYLWALRQEGRIIAIGLTDKILLALGNIVVPIDETYFDYLAVQYEQAARALGLRTQALGLRTQAPTSGSSLLWWGLAGLGALWAVNRYVIGGK